ncbi:S41 family peptidase [Candidatus Poribacteria bacterium]
MSAKRKTLYTIIALQAFIFIFAILIGHSLGKAQTRDDITHISRVNMINEAMRLIRNKYKEENVAIETLVQGAIKGMTESLQETYDDPYSQFMVADTFRETMDDTTGRYGGLGIEIGITSVNGYRRLTVMSTFDDTPANKAGLEAGDYIIKIDGELTYGITIGEAKQKLRGEPGEKVKLTVVRETEEESLDIVVTRGLIKIPTVKSKILAEDIGYIRLTQFSDTTPKAIDEELDKFEKARVKGIILDLRTNPGGTLSAAVDVASDFLKEDQLVVYTQGREPEDRKEYRVRKGAPHPWHPLVILVDRWSASGSEIVVGAIKDHKRGLIIGGENPTFGKGSVQTIFPMEDGATGLKLTVAHYHTPSGANINKIGIEPDIKHSGSTPSEVRMFRKLSNSESLEEFIKEAGDDILTRLKHKVKKDDEDPDRELFRSFVKKLSQEDIVLSESLIKLAIAQETKSDIDEYEYDPLISLAIGHLRAFEVLDING